MTLVNSKQWAFKCKKKPSGKVECFTEWFKKIKVGEMAPVKQQLKAQMQLKNTNQLASLS